MNTLLDKYLAHYDPLHRGWTPRGIATGVCATNGFFFPRIRGGTHLRRGVVGVPPMTSPIVGAGAAGATTIREFPWITSEPGTACVYRLNAIGPGGVEETGERAVAVVAFDAAGCWRGPMPNAPANLQVRALAGGCFELRWTYTPRGRSAEPAEFRVFSDGGTGVMDYSLAVATVACEPGRVRYRWPTDVWPHGTRVMWSVRAVSAAGIDDGNTITMVARADAEGPTAAPSVQVR